MNNLSSNDREILKCIAGYTMTSAERQVALVQAVHHIVRRGIAGCIVECGIWRGGSVMAIAMAFVQEGDVGRNLYLFDTYVGMASLTEVDKTFDGTLAQVHLDRDINRTSNVWAIAGIDDVRKNMASTGYPQERISYVKGPVEAMLPHHSPAEPIALLRLDTDWYESTKHELVHLFPLITEGGFLIIDDYGHWEGTKKAVDEYFAGQPRHYYMHRIDYTGRLIIKQ